MTDCQWYVTNPLRTTYNSVLVTECARDELSPQSPASAAPHLPATCAPLARAFFIPVDASLALCSVSHSGRSDRSVLFPDSAGARWRKQWEIAVRKFTGESRVANLRPETIFRESAIEIARCRGVSGEMGNGKWEKLRATFSSSLVTRTLPARVFTLFMDVLNSWLLFLLFCLLFSSFRFTSPKVSQTLTLVTPYA